MAIQVRKERGRELYKVYDPKTKEIFFRSKSRMKAKLFLKNEMRKEKIRFYTTSVK